MTPDQLRRVVDDVLTAIRTETGDEAYRTSRFPRARSVFEEVAWAADFPDCLTLAAARVIDRPPAEAGWRGSWLTVVVDPSYPASAKVKLCYAKRSSA